MDINAGRMWRVAVDGRTANGRRVQLVIMQRGYDAGDAWRSFDRSFRGAKWERISVTEVKPDERHDE